MSASPGSHSRRSTIALALWPALALLATTAAILVARYPQIGLAVVALVPAGLLLRRREAPAAVAVFLLFANVFVVASRFHGIPRVAALALPGLLLIPVLRRVLVRGEPVVLPRVMLVVGLFQLVQILGVLVAIRPDEALVEVAMNLCEGAGLFVLLVNAVRTREELRACVLAIVLAGGFIGGLTMYQAATGAYQSDFAGFAQMSDTDVMAKNLATGGLLRHGGPIGEKNRFAQVLLIGLPLSLAFIPVAARRWLLLVGPSAIGMLGGIVLTRSRGAVIAAGGVVVALVIIRRVSLRLLLLLGLLLTPAVALLGAQYVERVGSIVRVAVDATTGSVAGADASIKGRLNEMGAAVLVFLDHPVTGVGPTMFKYHYRDYADIIGLRVHNADRASHSLYLQVAAEHGLPGLVLFLLICWQTVSGLQRALRAADDDETCWLLTALQLSLLGYLLSGMFLSFSFVRYFWLLLALCWVGISLARPAAQEATA